MRKLKKLVCRKEILNVKELSEATLPLCPPVTELLHATQGNCTYTRGQAVKGTFLKMHLPIYSEFGTANKTFLL